jgi:hypothetical protein
LVYIKTHFGPHFGWKHFVFVFYVKHIMGHILLEAIGAIPVYIYIEREGDSLGLQLWDGYFMEYYIHFCTETLMKNVVFPYVFECFTRFPPVVTNWVGQNLPGGHNFALVGSPGGHKLLLLGFPGGHKIWRAYLFFKVDVVF